MPRLPLDVLAQQIVAICSGETWTVDELERVVRGAYPVRRAVARAARGGARHARRPLPVRRVRRAAAAGGVGPRAPARCAAATGLARWRCRTRARSPTGASTPWCCPTAPGWASSTRRWSTRRARGQTFMLGASTWRIEEITRDRVVVTPAPGAPGAVPFWKGEGVGRPYELGEAVGRLARELVAAGPERAAARLRDESAFDRRAATNLVAYLEDQAAATGTVPSDRAIVVERFRDEIGDWRLCVLTPFGARVHAPWAWPSGARLRAATGQEAHAIWGDDGIALHLPDADEAPPVRPRPDRPRRARGAGAGRARRHGPVRRPLPRERGPRPPHPPPPPRAPHAPLAAAAEGVLAAPGGAPVRQLPRDPRDLPRVPRRLVRPARACAACWAGSRSRELAVVEVETATASPFAGSLLFEYVASYMYEDDTPAAERRAQALSLNRDLLRELLGQEELRDLIDADALAALEADLQGLSERARARGADGLHDLLRRIGDLSPAEIGPRLADPGDGRRRGATSSWPSGGPARSGSAARSGSSPPRTPAATATASGAMPPSGLPEAFLEPVPDALRGLVARYARAHGPFHTAEVGRALRPASPGARRRSLAALETDGRAGARRAAPRRIRARVVRRRGRAPPAPRQPGGAAAGDRAGRPAGPRALPARLAAGRPAGRRARRRRPAGRARAAAGARPAGRPVGGRGAPAAAGRLRPRRASTSWPPAARSSGWARAPAASAAGGWRSTSARTRRCSGPPPGRPARRRATVADALRAALAGGASFWDDLLVAAARPRARTSSPPSGRWSGPARSPTTSGCRCAPPRRLPPPPRPGAGGRRRRVGGAGRGAPSAVAGRWSLAEPLFRDAPAAGRAAPRPGRAAGGAARRPHPVGRAVGGRPGRLSPPSTRPRATSRPSGACRRGYFVEGLGGAQFAMPGAVERLRDLRDAPARRATRTSSCWARPTRPSRTAPRSRGRGARARRSPSRVFGAQVVLVDGVPRVYLERGGRGLLTFEPAEPGRARAPPSAALAAWVVADRRRRAAIERVDGEPVFGSPARGRAGRRPASAPTCGGWCCAHRRRRTGRGRVPRPPHRS